jgi:hypothetical protein
MGQRLTWVEIVRSRDLRGRWVALDRCRYERGLSHPVEADVVDADEDLSELCNRIREADRSHCAIVFCEEDTAPAASRRPGHADGNAASPRLAFSARRV